MGEIFLGKENVVRYHSDSEKETEAIGKALAPAVGEGELVALYGEMGSGKTAFTRGFVSALIPDARVTSPTYALLNQYTDGDRTVNHFDLYRVSSEDDLISIGFWDVLEQGVTLTEWSENAEEFLPLPRWEVRFQKTGETGRDLTVERVEA